MNTTPTLQPLTDTASGRQRGRKAQPAGGTAILAQIEPLTVNIDQAAAMVGISPNFFRELDSAGRVPMPIKLGARILWSVADLRLWVDAGCPDRERFTAIKAQRRRE